MMGLTSDDLLAYAGTMFQVKAFLVANKLGMLGAIAATPRTAPEVAEALALDPRAVEIVLRAVAAKGIAVLDGRSAYRLAEAARPALDPESPQFLGAWLDNHDNVWDALGRLEDTVRSGTPALPTAHYRVTKEAHEHFVRATHNTAVVNAPILARGLPAGEAATLLDLGGGPGSYAVFFCREHPRLRATVFDLPASEPVARDMIRRYELEDRIRFQGGDYFVDAIEGMYDACLISHIVHAYSPADNRTLVAKAFAALNPGGRLWIHDFIPQPGGIEPEFPSGFAVRMLALTAGGNVYTSDELAAWCRDAGFRATRWVQLGQGRGVSVLEATK